MPIPISHSLRFQNQALERVQNNKDNIKKFVCITYRYFAKKIYLKNIPFEGIQKFKTFCIDDHLINTSHWARAS